MTKETARVVEMVKERQKVLYDMAIIDGPDEPVGVAPSYRAAAQRAVSKGLLEEPRPGVYRPK